MVVIGKLKQKTLLEILETMKTFKEFLNDVSVITERYYEPNEKRPSGTTPLQAAKKKGITGEKLRKVERGADNKEIDTSPQKGVEIKKQYDSTIIHHPESGLEYEITDRGEHKKTGKRHYGISWWDMSKTAKTPEEKRKLAHTAKKIWHKNVQHTLPHGSIVSNEPASEKHGSIYKRQGLDYVSPTGIRLNYALQFGKVGRMPSPKQQAKGKKTRLSPFTQS
jgi:hypothetical protein